MFVNQLSVFIENREGRLDQVLEILKENNINIISLSLADSSDYGLLRMIVSDPDEGKLALRSKGFSAMLTPVLAVKLSHKVGQLQILLSEICKAGINIEYMYALATGGDDASIVIKTADLEKAAEILGKTGVELIGSADL
ncbi:MAG: amino acid-binding protein [Schaedlerella sp.]|nr:amino acid-binding protein [Lachnospiraceae bacterium]MDY4201896.1 amino acid-binding protein [Schaedlerella sp.]